MNRSYIHWPCLPLSEAFWFQEGPGVRKWQFTDSGIKLLNVGNIEKEGTLNLAKTDRHLSEEEVAKKYSHFLVDVGDLVIASSGISFDDDGLLRTRGAFVEKHQLPLCLNTSTIRFKAIEGVSDLCFLRFWLNGHEFRSQITKLVTGTAQQNFGPSHLKAIKITLPPLEEQRRIAEILDRAEELRAKRREAIAQLDTLTQAIFIEMFGDPVRNPKLHPVVRLGSLTKISSGSTPSRKQPENFDGNIPWVKTTEVNGYLITDTEEKITKSALQNSSCHVYPVGSILIALYGQGKTRGQCAVLGIEAATNQACGVLLPNPSYITNFLFAQLSMSYSRLRAMARGGNQENLNLGLIADFTVLLPCLPLQQEFAHRVEAVEKIKAAHCASLSELNALFASLQNRAFKGEL